MSLVVIVPTRKRPHLCERLLDSFVATRDEADIVFVTDGDDDSYDNFDFRKYGHAVLSPRGTLVQKLNQTAAQVADVYDQIMWLGDDHEFVTKHWDTLMVKKLQDMGGSGWLYPNNGRRSDVPESWLVSSDIVRELGYYANPNLNHYYIDNSTAELGKRSQLIRYCPDIVIKHRHYVVDDTAVYDDVYQETERTFGKQDLATFGAWRTSNQVASDVSKLRRAFNPDVAWVKTRY
jgi:hypothetical protein